MPIDVERRTLPPAGIDIVDITIRETYQVEGIGEDTVLLRGELEADRGPPLYEHGETRHSWETSTVVAQFTNLNLVGRSDVFGDVRVTLDRSVPSFGVVTNGKCKASIALRVTMPEHGLVLHGSEPVQLHSQVETVPPIGDERTQSVLPVTLVDAQTRRVRGTMTEAVVAWRELLEQRAWRVGEE